MRRTRPNVLLLFADQHQAAVLGAEGHPDAATPHLDRLAAEGTRFTRAYCQDGICLPSRCSMITGLYPRTLGCYDNGDRSPVLRQVVPLQAALSSAGYTTAAFGKRHLVDACDDGWDIAASHLHHESPDDSYVAWVEARGLGEAFAHDWAAEFGRGASGGAYAQTEIPFALMATRDSRLPAHATMEAWTRQRTLAFLEDQVEREAPFFCWSSFYRPHQPYTPLPAWRSGFDASGWGAGTRAGEPLALPASLRQDPADLPPLFQALHEGRNRVWRVDLARQDEQLFRDYIAAYHALVAEIDDHIGAILNTLEATGLSRDTIVIYASDHGDFVGAHAMIEKCATGHNVYEETLRVPLIVHWPGHIRSGAVRHDLVELVDLYPTLLELCRVDAPDSRWPLQGRSLAAALTDGRPVGREFIVSENWSQSTVITPDWKLGHWQDPGDPRRGRDYRAFGDLLFERESDPHEVHNRLGDPAAAATQRELRDMLAAWEAATPEAVSR